MVEDGDKTLLLFDAHLSTAHDVYSPVGGSHAHRRECVSPLVALHPCVCGVEHASTQEPPQHPLLVHWLTPRPKSHPLKLVHDTPAAASASFFFVSVVSDWRRGSLHNPIPCLLHAWWQFSFAKPSTHVGGGGGGEAQTKISIADPKMTSDPQPP